MEIADDEPDCFDLNDWMLLTHPTVYNVIKYLSPTPKYNFMRKFWIDKCKPEIREVQDAS